MDIKVNHQLISLNAGHYYIKKDHATGNVNLVIYRYVDNVVLAYNPELFVGVFYDGRDAEVVTDQLLNKNRACGLCGDNNGEYNTDVRTPRHCVMSEPRLGAYSYVLDNKVDRCLSQDDLRKYRHEIGNCEYKVGLKSKLKNQTSKLKNESSKLKTESSKLKNESSKHKNETDI